MPETQCILVAWQQFMFLTLPNLSMNVNSGEGNCEARVLERYPQSGDKLHGLGDGRADSDVPPSQLWDASLPFQLSVKHCVGIVVGWMSPVLLRVQEAGFLIYSVFLSVPFLKDRHVKALQFMSINNAIPVNPGQYLLQDLCQTLCDWICLWWVIGYSLNEPERVVDVVLIDFSINLVRL